MCLQLLAISAHVKKYDIFSRVLLVFSQGRKSGNTAVYMINSIEKCSENARALIGQNEFIIFLLIICMEKLISSDC